MVVAAWLLSLLLVRQGTKYSLWGNTRSGSLRHSSMMLMLHILHQAQLYSCIYLVIEAVLEFLGMPGISDESSKQQGKHEHVLVVLDLLV